MDLQNILINNSYKIKKLAGETDLLQRWEAYSVLSNCLVFFHLVKAPVGQLEPARLRIFKESLTKLTHVFHSGTEKISEWNEWQGRLYLVTETVQGENLKQYLANTRARPEFDPVYALILICKTLDYLHRINIYHQRLDSEHIFLYISLNNALNITISGLYLHYVEELAGRTPERTTSSDPARSDITAVGSLMEWMLKGLGSLPAPLMQIKQKVQDENSGYREIGVLLKDLITYNTDPLRFKISATQASKEQALKPQHRSQNIMVKHEPPPALSAPAAPFRKTNYKNLPPKKATPSALKKSFQKLFFKQGNYYSLVAGSRQFRQLVEIVKYHQELYDYNNVCTLRITCSKAGPSLFTLLAREFALHLKRKPPQAERQDSDTPSKRALLRLLSNFTRNISPVYIQLNNAEYLSVKDTRLLLECYDELKKVPLLILSIFDCSV